MATVLALVGDEVSLFTLQDILESFGHVLVPATDADDALRVVQNQSFDLLLVDLMADNLKPLSFVDRVFELRPGTVVAAITNYPKDPVSQQILDRGVQTLLRKPFEIGRILHLLEGQP